MSKTPLENISLLNVINKLINNKYEFYLLNNPNKDWPNEKEENLPNEKFKLGWTSIPGTDMCWEEVEGSTIEEIIKKFIEIEGELNYDN